MENSKPTLVLVGEDGNAFSIIAKARKVLRKNGMRKEMKEFTEKATSGNYDNLLATCMEYFSVE
jgi:hypothetical protein